MGQYFTQLTVQTAFFLRPLTIEYITNASCLSLVAAKGWKQRTVLPIKHVRTYLLYTSITSDTILQHHLSSLCTPTSSRCSLLEKPASVGRFPHSVPNPLCNYMYVVFCVVCVIWYAMCYVCCIVAHRLCLSQLLSHFELMIKALDWKCFTHVCHHEE